MAGQRGRRPLGRGRQIRQFCKKPSAQHRIVRSRCGFIREQTCTPVRDDTTFLAGVADYDRNPTQSMIKGSHCAKIKLAIYGHRYELETHRVPSSKLLCLPQICHTQARERTLSCGRGTKNRTNAACASPVRCAPPIAIHDLSICLNQARRE
jgi:hypothetical protein